MSKNLEISRLCDAYGALLTEHRLEILREFYDYDYSLAEIAENFGFTRQAALGSIRKAEKQLFDYEAKLGLIKKSDELKTALRQLADDMGNIGDDEARERLVKLIEGI
ncbi:MAG: DNA-binding protein [Clostridiales bacterium]|nr:DNA-binding protein [Clostridiales bacterium]